MKGVWKLFVLGACCAAMMGGSCDRFARKHPVTLESAVFDFHQAIRTGRYEDATAFMAPQWREPFMKSWRRGTTAGSIHELEVLSISRSEDAEYARVEASLRYLTHDSLVEHTFNLFEMWKGEGKSWYIDALLEGPPEFHEAQAQPWAPPPGEATPQ